MPPRRFNPWVLVMLLAPLAILAVPLVFKGGSIPAKRVTAEEFGEASLGALWLFCAFFVLLGIVCVWVYLFVFFLRLCFKPLRPPSHRESHETDEQTHSF
jgi:hypothetical protein